MNDLVKPRLPASFIQERVILTAAEMALGPERGWLRPNDLVDLTLEKLKVGVRITPAEEEIALTLPEDLDQVADLIPKLNVSSEPLEERQRVWLYLILDWLLHHGNAVQDPFEIIELLYDDFGHPDEIRDLVRYMPVPPDEAASTIDERWRDYLERERLHYAARNEAFLS